MLENSSVTLLCALYLVCNIQAGNAGRIQLSIPSVLKVGWHARLGGRLEVLLMVLSMTRIVTYVELSGSASDSVLPKLKIKEFKRETICLPLIIRIAFGTHIIKGRFTLSFSSMMRLSRINSLC